MLGRSVVGNWERHMRRGSRAARSGAVGRASRAGGEVSSAG